MLCLILYYLGLSHQSFATSLTDLQILFFDFGISAPEILFKMLHHILSFPSNSRSNQSSSGSSLPLCSPYSGDRRAQQTLYMGCPDNLVSFSPSSEHERQVSVPGIGSLISPHHLTLLTPMYQSTPRIVYPSSTYLHGNPGFYYDIMQHNHHAGSQTTLLQAPTPDCVPNIPSNPTVHFGNTSPLALPQDFQHYSSIHGVLLPPVTQGHQSTTYDTPFDNTIDIEMLSIGLALIKARH
jgi:hypothetical protein